MRISDRKYGMLLALPGSLFLVFLVAVPTGLLFVISFLRYDFIHPISFYGFENFRRVLSDRVFRLALWRTVVYCSGVTLLTLLVGLILASSASRIKRFSGVFRTLLILPWAVPLIVSGLVWRWMLDPGVGIYSHMLMQLGLTETPINIFGEPILAMVGCILADGWTRVPFMFIIILAGIESIPQDLYEVARVDGANILQTFRHITLPLSRKSILMGVLITSMFSFRTIDSIWSMTRGGPAKATYVLGFNLVDYIILFTNLGYASAVGILMLLMIVAFAGALMYYLIKE